MRCLETGTSLLKLQGCSMCFLDVRSARPCISRSHAVKHTVGEVIGFSNEWVVSVGAFAELSKQFKREARQTPHVWHAMSVSATQVAAACHRASVQHENPLAGALSDSPNVSICDCGVTAGILARQGASSPAAPAPAASLSPRSCHGLSW